MFLKFNIYFVKNILYLLGKKRVITNISSEMCEKLRFEFSSNNVSDDGQLLVLFQYNTSEEMRLLRMHPEVLLADTTHGTNKERKEIFTIAAKDGTNTAFNACRAFIPNAQQWGFELLFKQCLPFFW